VVPIWLVVPVEREDVVTDSDSIELLTDAEVGSKSSLHIRLTTSNGKAKGNRDIVDDVLKGVAVFNGAEKSWTMTRQAL
jgi:hypothetical protein